MTKAIKKLGKLPKRGITVDELLNTEAIAEMANKLIEEKLDIQEAILITTDQDGVLHINYIEPISRAWAIGLLEMAKHQFMESDE